MVLNFATIPLHLQKQVAQQLEICDFMQFQLSSNYGKDVGNMVKTKIAMDVVELTITEMYDEDGLYMETEHIERITWDDVRSHENCPLFCDMTNERLIEIITEAEQGYYHGKDAKLFCFGTSLSKIKVDIFCWLLEVFRVTKIYLQGGAPTGKQFFKTDLFRKLQAVEVGNYIDDDDILALGAHTIRCLSDSPNLRQTMNKFLKQWYLNNREIVDFFINRNHEARENWNESDRNEKEDGTKLSILITENYISVGIVQNPEEYLISQLGYEAKRKYKALCRL